MSDSLPPHSMEAERGVISCLLQEPALITATRERIETPRAFYDLRHQTLFKVLLGMFDRGQPIDRLSLECELLSTDQIADVGGLPYLGNEVEGAAPSPAGLSYYLEILEEKQAKRRWLKLAGEINSGILAGEQPGPEILQAATEILGSTTTKHDKPVAVSELIEPFKEEMDQLMKGETPDCLKTGFIDLDRMTGGLFPGELTIIAARPGTGKSSLAVNICENVCLEKQTPVALFSLEMSRREIFKRIVSSQTRINGKVFRAGPLSSSHFPEIARALGRLKKAALFIDDNADLGITEIRSRARGLVKDKGVRLVVVDYIQLLSVRHRSETRQADVSEMSRGLKCMAKELAVPVIALSQLNRNSEREGREPRLSDLRESGAIEQDADCVLLLWEDTDAGRIHARLAKQRNSEVGAFDLVFLRQFTRFESAARNHP